MAPLNLSSAILRLQPANCKRGARLLVIRGPRQRNNSWTDAQRMAMLDTIMAGFQCTVYIIQDPPGSKKCDEVFDGAHKLETACDFVMGKFQIKKVKSDMINWETSPLNCMVGKYYSDLSEQEQLIFDNYEFIVNIIPPEIAEDPDQLTTLWIRLNNSGNRVNEYESYLQIYRRFYDFLSEQAIPWFETAVFPGKESKRGELETELMRMLALSEPAISPNFVSQDDIYKQWRKTTFGETSKVDAAFAAKKEDLTKRLKHLHTVYKKLERNIMFKDSTNKIVRRVLIGRIAYWCDSVAKLTHCSDPIIEYASTILKTSTEELMKRLDCAQPNVKYQRRLLDMINRGIQDIESVKSTSPKFPRALKHKKLTEQDGKCTWCFEPISDGQQMVGHHIRPYRDGGMTTYDNLAVLHDECHKELHANPNKKRRME